MKLLLLIASMSTLLADPLAALKMVGDEVLIQKAKDQPFDVAVKTLLGVKNMNTDDFRGALDNLFMKQPPRGTFAHTDIFVLAKGGYPEVQDRADFYDKIANFGSPQSAVQTRNRLDVSLLEDLENKDRQNAPVAGAVFPGEENEKKAKETPLERFKRLVTAKKLDQAIQVLHSEIDYAETPDALIFLGKQVTWSNLSGTQQQSIKLYFTPQSDVVLHEETQGQILTELRKAGKKDFADKLSATPTGAPSAAPGAQYDEKQAPPLERFKRLVAAKNLEQAINVLNSEISSYDDTVEALIFLGKQVQWNDLKAPQQQAIKPYFDASTDAGLEASLQQRILTALRAAGKNDFANKLSASAAATPPAMPGAQYDEKQAKDEKVGKAKGATLTRFKRLVTAKKFDDAVRALAAADPATALGTYADTVSALIFLGQKVKWGELKPTQQTLVKNAYAQLAGSGNLQQQVIDALRKSNNKEFADKLGAPASGAPKQPKVPHKYKPRKTQAQRARSAAA